MAAYDDLNEQISGFHLIKIIIAIFPSTFPTLSSSLCSLGISLGYCVLSSSIHDMSLSFLLRPVHSLLFSFFSRSIHDIFCLNRWSRKLSFGSFPHCIFFFLYLPPQKIHWFCFSFFSEDLLWQIFRNWIMHGFLHPPVLFSHENLIFFPDNLLFFQW